MHLASTIVHSILTVTALCMQFSVLLRYTNLKTELCVIDLEQQKDCDFIIKLFRLFTFSLAQTSIW